MQHNAFPPPARQNFLRVALVFPNTAYVGMSNLGFHIVFQLFSALPNITCDRIFLPDKDTGPPGARSRKGHGPVKSKNQLHKYDLIAFSLSYENDYPNILTLLDQSGIPVRANERSGGYPLVIAGGITVFLNPEPLAEIFDLFIMGEAEEILPEFVERLCSIRNAAKHSKPDAALFREIAGIYVPSGYQDTISTAGHLTGRITASGFPPIATSQKIVDINTTAAMSELLPAQTEFSGMHLVEVSRGCPRGCRFCAAGRLYRPYRTRNFERLIKEIKPALDVQHKIGILGAAVSDHPQLTELLDHIASKGSRVSVSSLRADCLTEKLVSRVKHGSQQTFTIAPEAGSERLRHVINKNLSTEDILTAVAVLAAAHITNIKLYFMIGLPTETDEDINAIIALTRQIKHQYYSQTKSQKWLNRITLSISPFVPKPFTPFQWHPYERLSTLKQKIKHISRALKRESKVTVYADLPKWGYIQTLLSRGDRRVFQLLQDAHRQGSTWSQTLRAAAVNADYYVYRLRTVDEVLPWDFINHGFSKDDLWQEYRQAVDN